jgi:hypothetical protein
VRRHLALDSGIPGIFYQQDRIAGQRLGTGQGAMVMEAAHYGDFPRKNRASAVTATEPVRELSSRCEPDKNGFLTSSS